MRAALRAAGVWAPPALLMAVIWFFSAQPDLDSGLGVIDLIGRKILHLAEYALLCLLWWRALRTRMAPRSAIAGALLLSATYAAIDEYHQTFVAGRTGSPIDIAIDVAGAALMALALRHRAADRVSVGRG
jgi:VanZ family protein